MEIDLDDAAKSLLISEKIEKMIGIVEHAKELRKFLHEDHKDLLTNPIKGHDEFSVALGLTRVSDNFFDEFETTLYEIAELARNRIERVGIKNVDLVEGIILLLNELKPRSIRHLENFINAATDGEWVDGLFIFKGKDSEFRCIDRSSDDARREFGLQEKK